MALKQEIHVIQSKQFCLLDFSKNLEIKIYKTIILPVVLFGCETWSLKLEEECRLRLFENRILRRIFGPKMDENGGGEGSKLRNFIACSQGV